VSAARKKHADPRDILVTDVAFSPRVRTCLDNEGIKDLGALSRLTGQELLRIPNFGKVCLVEVTKKLFDVGLTPVSVPGPASPVAIVSATEHYRLWRLEPRLSAIEGRLVDIESLLRHLVGRS
jgi:hypothetical protein